MNIMCWPVLAPMKKSPFIPAQEPVRESHKGGSCHCPLVPASAGMNGDSHKLPYGS
jgi:hypothetical protein